MLGVLIESINDSLMPILKYYGTVLIVSGIVSMLFPRDARKYIVGTLFITSAFVYFT